MYNQVKYKVHDIISEHQNNSPVESNKQGPQIQPPSKRAEVCCSRNKFNKVLFIFKGRKSQFKDYLYLFI